MNRRITLPIGPARQQGAALVIGLILLLVLTVLAISGMNSASVQLLMAGNEQYRQNAFRAAETGIELAMWTYNNDVDALTGNPPPDITGASGGATYTVSTTPQMNGNILTAEAGHDFEVAGSIHYLFQSVGNSTRGAAATNWQGVAKLAPRTSSDQGAASPLPGDVSAAVGSTNF